jgi:hypothetical protein
MPSRVKRPDAQDHIGKLMAQGLDQVKPTETYFGHALEVRELGIELELPGARAHQRARLAFLRSGVQMFGDITNGSLFLSYRLFHQKTREHCSRSFVEPLLEECIDFFFKIGRVIKSREFKRLQRWDRGLLQILPWRADISGTHFGDLLG